MIDIVAYVKVAQPNAYKNIFLAIIFFSFCNADQLAIPKKNSPKIKKKNKIVLNILYPLIESICIVIKLLYLVNK